MKRTLLSKLHINGAYYLGGALLLLIGVPLYQALVLLPQGYEGALASTAKSSFPPYLLWISSHQGQFWGYRGLLISAFVCLLSLPFTLFRIIIAQEILGREEEPHQVEETETGEKKENANTGTHTPDGIHNGLSDDTPDAMPTDAWRGKGFTLLAAWSGFLSIILYTFGTLASTIYLTFVSSTFSLHTAISGNFSVISATLTIIANTIGGGLLALSCLFFGAIIASSGLKLWPGIWVAFGYTALAVAALLSGNAVAVATAPTIGQSPLTTPAILLFALWVLWFGIMLVRLKPEA